MDLALSVRLIAWPPQLAEPTAVPLVRANHRRMASEFVEYGMKTSIDIPRNLLEDVRKASNSRTNRDAVTAALEEYLRHHRSTELVEILGTFSEFVDHDTLDSHRGES